MNLFLKELSIRHADEFIVLICDKAPCHSKGVLNVPNNIRLSYLPPYCPELNPSENMWDEMREKFFTNLVFDSLDAVMDKLEEAMIFYQQCPQIVKSITSFHWITPHI